MYHGSIAHTQGSFLFLGVDKQANHLVWADQEDTNTPTYKPLQETSSRSGRLPHFPAPCQWSMLALGVAEDSWGKVWQGRRAERAKLNKKREHQRGLMTQQKSLSTDT